jgi:hypothetical protein
VPEEVRDRRAGGVKKSGYGWELAVVTGENEPWAIQLLSLLMGYTQEQGARPLDEGHWMPFGFSSRERLLLPFVGWARELGFEPEGVVQVLAFWPYLFPRSAFATSTGSFGILVATGITTGEFELVEKTSVAHVLLLLCKAGLGQLTDPRRVHVLRDSKHEKEWQRIAKLTEQDAARELRAGIGTWNVLRT